MSVNIYASDAEEQLKLAFKKEFNFELNNKRFITIVNFESNNEIKKIEKLLLSSLDKNWNKEDKEFPKELIEQNEKLYKFKILVIQSYINKKNNNELLLMQATGKHVTQKYKFTLMLTDMTKLMNQKK